MAQGLRSEDILRRIRDLNLQIDDMRGNWYFTLTMFALSFIFLGTDTVLLLNNLGEYSQITNSTVANSSLPSLLFQWEMALFMAGVVLLIVGFLFGAAIPEGPVASERALRTLIWPAHKTDAPKQFQTDKLDGH
jgi:hypothetical protein